MKRFPLIRLGDICSQVRGVSYGKDEIFDAPLQGTIPLLRATNILNDGVISNSSVLYVSEKCVKKWQHLCDADVLVTASTGSKSAIGRPGRVVEGGRVTFGAFCKIIRPNLEKVDPGYFWFLFVRSEYRELISNSVSGANINNIRNEHLDEMMVPLPPLATQCHIAKMLEQADSLRRQAHQMESALQELRRSVFLSSVGPRAEGYGSWEVMEVSELASAEKNSMRTGPFGSALKHSEFVDSGIAVIGIDNAVSDQFQWRERRFISEEKYQSLKKYRVFPGDVIVTIMGTTGRSAIVPDDVPLAISTKHLATITLDLEKATPEFLKYAIQYHPLIAEQVAAQNKGAVMDGLNLGIIKKLKLPVPPLAIQQDLSRAMKALDAESETLAKNTENFEQLFNSLMQRAFKGELTPKVA